MKPNPKTGFTLVELLVSICILVIMMVMLMGVFDVFNKSYTRSTSNMQTFDDVRAIVSEMSHDVSAAMVRTNANRTLNFLVQTNASGVQVFMAVPDPKLQSLTNMSFTSHIVYFWLSSTNQLYRAVYNTQIDTNSNNPLLSTASSANGTNWSANRTRLLDMTIAYFDGAGGNPYGWTTDPLIVNAMNLASNEPLLRNVFSFNVLCYTNGASISTAPTTTNAWSDPTNLPRYLKMELGVANDKDAAFVMRNAAATNLLENFEVTVPMMNYGVTNNNYGPQ